MDGFIDAGGSSAVAGGAAAVALGFREAVAGEESRRMWIAADPAHLVAAHAVRSVALVMAGRAALDVAPRGIAVERARSGQAPARRMGVERAGPRRDALVLVAALAERGRMAALAGGGIRPHVHRMPPKEILPMDEPAIRPIDQLGLDRHHRGLRMAVEAEVLIVAGPARLLGGARQDGMAAQEVSLVRHQRHR